MIYNRDTINNFNTSSELEWVETNGLGGYASGTVSGALTRRYHGLLIAAIEPPVKRTVVLSKLDETIVTEDVQGNMHRYELGCNQYPGTVHPMGFRYLVRFERQLFPSFWYEAGEVKLKKTVAAVHGENTTLVLYESLCAKPFRLELLPLASSRDHHSICRANPAIDASYHFENGLFRTMNYHNGIGMFVNVPGSTFTEQQSWYYNFEYLRELERGLSFQEDLYSHGHFSVTMYPGESIGVVISTSDPSGKNAFDVLEKEKQRREKLSELFMISRTDTRVAVLEAATEPLTENEAVVTRLVRAADQFIVRRGVLHTIIAGYPWFSDWGRDTMISLPGLCLLTGRFNVAKDIIDQFIPFISQGMLPNRFPDHGESPEYNTIDASLWFFNAVYQYHRATNDIGSVREWMPALSDIVASYTHGTRYGIRIDPADQLLRGGEPGVQLTWMDAKIGSWVVTPRMGKPVEVNALWYNALCIMADLYQLLGEMNESRHYAARAGDVLASFNKVFWNAANSCLFDFIDDTVGQVPQADIRPNQIYAISLPFPLVQGDRARSVLNVVGKLLLTPYGLRSLAPGSLGYAGMCVGEPLQRDAAYHQGTVWNYLIGAYIDALFKVEGPSAYPQASALVKSCCSQLDVACVGSVSEIFDGDFPHAPRGCIAQAWSVAELLRVVVQHRFA